MESTCPDPSSSCNYHEVLVTQWDWIVDVDFSSKKLLCAITIDATSMKDGASVLVGIYTMVLFTSLLFFCCKTTLSASNTASRHRNC